MEFYKCRLEIKKIIVMIIGIQLFLLFLRQMVWYHLLPLKSSQFVQVCSYIQWFAPPTFAFSRPPCYRFKSMRKLQGLHFPSLELKRLTPWVLLCRWKHLKVTFVKQRLLNDRLRSGLSHQNHYLRRGLLLWACLLLWVK